MLFSRSKNIIWQNMLANTEEATPYFSILGWVLVITYIGFYFFNSMVAASGGYENITLRVVISIFGFILILYNYLPQYIIKIFPLLFYIILLFSFPFFFTYMMLHNQNYGAWQVKELVGLVLLSFFVDWKAFLVLLSLGIGLAFILVPNEYVDWHNLVGIFGSYSAPVIYFLIFSKKRQQLQGEKENYNANIIELNNSLESKVKIRTAELEEALLAKTEFINNVSHEVRTPIQGFTILSEGLVNHWSEFDSQKKLNLAMQVCSNAKRLALLINNLLDLSKFAANKMLMCFDMVNLDKSIKNIITECNNLYLGTKSIEIKFNNKCEKAILAVDEERICQVLRNLFVNAIKFSPDGGSIIASLEAVDNKNDSKHIHFTVTDAGIGIPEEELTTIFDPFVQSTRSKVSVGGTGLGLSICKQIIEAHHGRIWATNNSDNGSSFHFVIPIVQFSYNAELSRSILMIDDEEVCLNSMELLLMDTPYSLIKASGGIMGLEYLRAHPDSVSLVLLDLMMPDIYGLNVLKEMKSDPYLTKIPVILQSGVSNPDEINKAYKMGVFSHLKKPYRKEVVISEIGKALS